MRNLLVIFVCVGFTLASSARAAEPVQYDDVVSSQVATSMVDVNPDNEISEAAINTYTDASCRDGHGVLHTAHCASPYVAACISPTAGQCVCSCYYKPHR